MNKWLILWGCRVLHSYSLPKRRKKNNRSIPKRTALRKWHFDDLTKDAILLLKAGKPNCRSLSSSTHVTDIAIEGPSHIVFESSRLFLDWQQKKRIIKRPTVSCSYITNILSVYSQESSERAHIRSLSTRLSLLYISSLSSLIPNRSSTKWGAV